MKNPVRALLVTLYQRYREVNAKALHNYGYDLHNSFTSEDDVRSLMNIPDDQGSKTIEYTL